MTLQTSNDPVSKAFVTARLSGTSLPDFPGALPATLEAAYAVQNQSISIFPDEVVGWKVGGIPDPFAAKLGATRLAGPIFKRAVMTAEGGTTKMPVFPGGFAAIEAEYVLFLGQDIAPGTVEDTIEAAKAVVSHIHIGVEIASSPLRAVNDLGPLSIISDFGNNAGLLVGPKIEAGTEADLSAETVTVDIDGERIGETPAKPNAPYEAVRFLIALCAGRGITLPKGTAVSTGAITGVHQAELGATSVVGFGKHGTMPLELVAAPDMSVDASA